jgi:hypothetical protein
MPWSDLVGETTLTSIRLDARHPFDANANGCAIELDNTTVFVFEDPSDGYRSSATEPLIIHAPLYSFGCDPEYVRVPVVVKLWEQSEYGEDADGIEIIDRRNGKTILRLGTDNVGDYYPSYTCEWQPQNIAENAEVR